jgi:anthranilate synthase component 1
MKSTARWCANAARDSRRGKVVPSRRFSLPCPSPLAAYDVLKKSNPSPYMFFMQDNDFTLFGASPESSLKYDAVSRQIEIYPIAGTRPRGAAPTARWIAISTAASSWKCAPTIKSFPST